MKKISSCIFLFAEYYRTMTSGWKGAPCWRRIDRELVFKTDDFVKEKLGGATVEPLIQIRLLFELSGDPCYGRFTIIIARLYFRTVL